MDFLGMSSHIVERSEQRLAQGSRSVEVAIVGAGHSCVMPEPFRRVEVRRIGWKEKHLDLAVVLGKIVQDFRLLVIGRIILNEKHSMTAAVKMRTRGHADGTQDLLQCCVLRGWESAADNRAAPKCGRGWASAGRRLRPRKRSPPLRRGLFF